MSTVHMIQQIESAVDDEKRSHRLRDIMVQVAQFYGRRPSAKELDDVIQFVVDYVKHVPMLLVAMRTAAARAGAQASIDPLLDACEQYWNAGLDIIPDHMGLLGYMDDAYYVLSIIQDIAERHRQADGGPLMGMNLTHMNQVMRALIGEPHATVLDTAVATAVGASAFNTMLLNLPFMAQPLVDRDPIWGNASIDEIVDVRMGALGIV